MDPFSVKEALATMTVLVDTREQDTARSRLRLKRVGVPTERCKLDFGDYSAKCDRLDLRNVVAIERKMDADELAACFGRERRRFQAEFERAKAAGARVYLLVENTTLDKIYAGRYRSKLTPEAYTASIHAWSARYDCHFVTCDELMSGKVIHDILYRELKERLEQMPDEEGECAETGMD